MANSNGNLRTVTVHQGLVRIDQRIRVARSEIGTDASGPACIFARVDVGKGRVAYLQDTGLIPAPKRFALFLPPFTLVQAMLERCAVSTVGLAFRPPPAAGLPSRPVLIPWDTEADPTTPAEAVHLVCQAEDRVNVERARKPLPRAAQAKTIIDADYGTPLRIARVARRLRASPPALSRSFKMTYGIPPVRYRHHVRIMDALLRFADGSPPLTVSQDVGFEDLSRFYKILQKVACAPPGRYRPARSRNAKT